jgi:hypothetical protein
MTMSVRMAASRECVYGIECMCITQAAPTACWGAVHDERPAGAGGRADPGRGPALDAAGQARLHGVILPDCDFKITRSERTRERDAQGRDSLVERVSDASSPAGDRPEPCAPAPSGSQPASSREPGSASREVLVSTLDGEIVVWRR